MSECWYIWRPESPANVAAFDTLADAQIALATAQVRGVATAGWCIVYRQDDDAPLVTVQEEPGVSSQW